MKPKKETLPIGTQIKVLGIDCEVLKSEECNHCVAYDFCREGNDIIHACASCERDDNTDVIFKPINIQ